MFAGLRPLAAPKDDSSKTREISRNHKIIVSKSKLITIIGGKWTTYRKMAEEMIDTAIRIGLLAPSVSTTKNFPVLEALSANGPYRLYGENGMEIAAIAEQDPRKKALIHPDLPYSWAEVEWICRNELVLHLEDLLARRLRELLLNARATYEIAEEVANKSATWLGWTPEQAAAETAAFRKLAENYILN